MTTSSIVSIAAAALLAALALPAAAQAPAAPAPAAAAATPTYAKIGFVSTERVMRESRASQQAQKALEAEFVKREKAITGGSPREIERRKAELAEDISIKRDEALKQLVERANAAIRRIAEAEKFDAVFAEAAYVDKRVDITDKVIKALDAGR
jgi:outer membrane protein